MKILLIALILLCLVCVMACEDIVIGEYPIMRVDDAVIVCPLPGDYYHVSLHDTYCYASVNRPYDDQTTIEFFEYYNGEILSVLIVKRPGDQE